MRIIENISRYVQIYPDMSRYVQIIQAETAKSQGAIAEQLSQTISNAHAHHARHARHARHASSDAFLLHIKCTGRHQTKLVVILHGRKKKKKMSRQGGRMSLGVRCARHLVSDMYATVDFF